MHGNWGGDGKAGGVEGGMRKKGLGRLHAGRWSPFPHYLLFTLFCFIFIFLCHLDNICSWAWVK